MKQRICEHDHSLVSLGNRLYRRHNMSPVRLRAQRLASVVRSVAVNKKNVVCHQHHPDLGAEAAGGKDDGLGGKFTQIHNSLTLILIISNLKTGREYRIRYAGRNIVYDANNMYECDSIH